MTPNDEDDKDKEFDTVVISQTLQGGAINSVAENTKCEPSNINAETADVNCGDESSSDESSSDEDSVSSNNDDSDVEPSIWRTSHVPDWRSLRAVAVVGLLQSEHNCLFYIAR